MSSRDQKQGQSNVKKIKFSTNGANPLEKEKGIDDGSSDAMKSYVKL